MQAHALAVQTGCEILVKLEDHTNEGMFFATKHLQEAYHHKGICHKPGEIQVCGETGAPLTQTVDTAVQSTDTMTPDPGGSSVPPSDSGIFMQDAFMEQLRSSKFGATNKSATKHRRSPDEYDTNGPMYETAAASPKDKNDHSRSSASKKMKTQHHHQENRSTTPSSGSDAKRDSPYSNQSKTQEASPYRTKSPYSSHLTDTKASASSSPGSNFSPASGKQYHCLVCGKKLKSARSLQKHTKTVHPQELTSPAASSSSHDIPPSVAVSRAMPMDDVPAFTPISPER